MALHWSTAAAASTENGVKCLVFGAAGSGKTYLTGTLPDPVIISAESGLLTYRKMIRDGIMSPDVPVLTITNFKELDEALEWCAKDAIKNGRKSVALDSVSEIAEQCLAFELSKTRDPRKAYGAMATEMVSKVNAFRDLQGLHVLVTAKQERVKDEVTGAMVLSPSAPGRQLGQDLPYRFDEVFHAFTAVDPATGATYHALRTHAAPDIDAKDRSGVLDEIEYPHMGNIIAKITA